MPDATLDHKSVHELQRIAIKAGQTSTPRRRRALSRGARLLLIDMLSRWSASGLALIAGCAIYLAVVVGRVYPTRAAAWTLLVLMSIWTCRTLRKQFRSGEKIAARPFRWRASYTSCLSVLGVAFGSAPILLVPEGAPLALLFQTIALACIAAIGASALHSAHSMSALGIGAPAILMGFLALIRSQASSPVMIGFLASVILGVGGVLFLLWTNQQQAGQRRPRTSVLRKDALDGQSARTPAGHPNEVSATAG